jgi:DNA polymerase III alpha subunit
MMSKKILKNRPYTSLADFRQRTKISDKLLKGLIVADAFREFGINKKKEFTGTDCADFNDLELAQLIYQHTTLKPKLKVLESFDFGKYEFIDLKDLNDEEKQKEFLNRQILIRGIVTQLINKDRLLLRQKHVHLYEPHLFYANIDDGTGNKALIFNPHTYEKYKKIVADLERKAVIAIATVSSSGKKLFCDMLEIVNGSDKELTAMLDAQKAKTKDIYITSAIPAVSKKGKSYYRVKLSDGADGLCFRFGEKLFPGQKIKYKITEKPFINIERAGG